VINSLVTIDTNIGRQLCCQEEEQLFQFHMANLENACGASLKYVSAFYWDHNEAFAQFGGPLCVLPRGLAMLMEHLAKGIDIQFNKKVGFSFTDVASPCVHYHHHTTTVLRPFFRDHPGDLVREENFWTSRRELLDFQKRTSGLYGARED